MQKKLLAIFLIICLFGTLVNVIAQQATGAGVGQAKAPPGGIGVGLGIGLGISIPSGFICNPFEC
jgi:hypothetical protein